MQVASEMRLGLMGLLVIQLLTSFGAIGVLSRMSPAVDRILRDNVYSMRAVDDMLLVLAGDGTPAAFAEALGRATRNVTEEEETAILAEIEEGYRRVLAGDEAARAEVAEELSRLAAVNRASMERADARVRALGWAGAWAMVLLGFTAFAATLLVYRRQERRLVVPIVEIHEAIAAARTGDEHRRCLRLEGPLEVQRIAADLNGLLDEVSRPGQPLAADATRRASQELLHLMLDARGVPVVAGSASGQVIGFSTVSLAADRGWLSPRELAEAIHAGAAPPQWKVQTTPGGAWLAELDPAVVLARRAAQTAGG